MAGAAQAWQGGHSQSLRHFSDGIFAAVCTGYLHVACATHRMQRLTGRRLMLIDIYEHQGWKRGSAATMCCCCGLTAADIFAGGFAVLVIMLENCLLTDQRARFG
eukprot:362009-Chlamydomonas_euryale.AAC.8